MGTAELRYGSILERRRWSLEHLIQAQSQSFMDAYTGGSFDSVVYRVNDLSKKDGHEVVFDFDGNLVSRAVKGKEVAFGTGETKRKFSDKVRVDRFRFVVDNGDKFDAAGIDATYLTEHSDSISKLADKFVRFKDQSLFDVAQQSVTERIIMENTFDTTALHQISHILSTGDGLLNIQDKNPAAKRRPMKPYKLQNGEQVYLFLIDSYMKTKFLKDSISILSNADVRGNDNRLIKGVIGKIGNLLIVEAPVFFGTSYNTKVTGDFVTSEGYADMSRTDIEISGLRQYFSTDGNKADRWSGEDPSVSAGANQMFSRGLILGAGALQWANGKSPEYKVKFSQDFDIKSESCLETWCGVKATKLYAENEDYAVGKVAGVAHGMIAVDVPVAAPGMRRFDFRGFGATHLTSEPTPSEDKVALAQAEGEQLIAEAKSEGKKLIAEAKKQGKTNPEQADELLRAATEQSQELLKVAQAQALQLLEEAKK